MKTVLSLALTTFFAMASLALAGSDKESISTLEKNIWQIIKEKKIDQFQKMLTSDFRGVYASGINKPDQEVKDVRALDIKSYTLGEMDVVFIDKDCALVTYPVTVEATDAGKDLSGKMSAASIWKKDGNDWRIAFHTDMKAE